MQYLGGKAKIAKRLVGVLNTLEPGRPCWEPFCGGLNMTTYLALGRAGMASDAHPALMSMFAHYREGWRPPEHITPEQYRACRTLPDCDPLKAFAGFCCSFGGRWFGGYARESSIVNGYHEVAHSRVLARTFAAIGHWDLQHLSFFDVVPQPMQAFVYADPPYENTTGYGAPFDHRMFWQYCQLWAQHTNVYVSEYACPVPATLVTEFARNKALSSNTERATERLFKILP